MDEKLVRDLEASCEKIKNNALWKMTRSNEVNRLKRKYAENESFYYDPQKDKYFLISYWYTDENKEEHMAYKFDEQKYFRYKNFMKDYNKNYSELKDKRQKLLDGFALFKEKKLQKINIEIEYYQKMYRIYHEFAYKEALSARSKVENQIIDEKLKVIEDEYIKQEIVQMFNNHPDYVRLDFNSVKIDVGLYVKILRYQKALREEKIKKSQKNQIQNVQERDM